MTAQYGLFRNPPHKGEKESNILHARIIPGRTIRIDRVTREISECTSFSPGDVKGLLQAFADVLVSYLEDGDEVELEGLGHFSVSLKCPKITTPRQVRAEDINFKSVNFRCSKEITERLRSMKVERKPGSSKPVKYTVEERKEKILKYLGKHETVMSSECMGINECTRYLALKDLKELIAEKKIVKEGYRKVVVYMLAKDGRDE
ncbi:HU family DNA-binding protein [Parabacteroides gordonii]|jgi:predicted histone-like DNA-binding protein|uniref:HU domain-containing protein n=1 Tax=Parabacteroides gordonii MS-1 = DSM 23371 TaxID=1203610 RepID=A0A0F5IY35_9BACT|nr:HU family DNA-binding protein [Parabacteroides gordonii]KKB50526.1 hypothetical protein HMPREF1536_04062 [Parabacteroides gordonii MS-1 = DSM 23371]MCA5585288.1 HU family DNA-binding protein [Parabacteroides gordonii]RGP16308.1 hypothetical protein DXB27_12415 [Parabacteroides gordonii]